MANITVLLREDIDNLGGRGEIVKVKSGYARNFLLPQKMATLASKGNIKQIEGERSALLRKSASEKSTADAQAEQMKDISLAFERRAGEGGTLFGSVTSMDIADAIKAKGYEIDRRKIVLKDAIKETGNFTVNVKLHRDVTIGIPVTVTAEGGSTESKAEKSAKVRTEKMPDVAVETTENNSDSAEEIGAEETAG
jgi:large subunit ribosomal protein L9